ncbi:hypothetical protein AC249_AIPGENE14268 [Exaiptasia diaphana]|nr:hypothetical protein AC249_AIPGENE14268 [Exaiptasia diaphana]
MKQQGLFQFGNIVKVSEGNILQKSESFLSKVTTKNEVECWVNCVLNERCFSLNVVFVNQTFLQCELFNWTGINWNASLAPKKNGYYAQIQLGNFYFLEKFLENIPCLESSRWKPVVTYSWLGHKNRYISPRIPSAPLERSTF